MFQYCDICHLLPWKLSPLIFLSLYLDWVFCFFTWFRSLYIVIAPPTIDRDSSFFLLEAIFILRVRKSDNYCSWKMDNYNESDSKKLILLSQFNSRPKIDSHFPKTIPFFGCTNIISADCIACTHAFNFYLLIDGCLILWEKIRYKLLLDYL